MDARAAPTDFAAYAVDVTQQIQIAFTNACYASIYQHETMYHMSAFSPTGEDAADTAFAGFEAGLPADAAAACYVIWKHVEYIKSVSLLKQMVSKRTL